MWRKLSAIHQKKTKENVLILQMEFYDYKMQQGDTMNDHIDKVCEMVQVLKDLGETISDRALLNKIVGSLPPSYNGVVNAWTNVEYDKQTLEVLSARLFRHELVLKMQGGDSNTEDSAFFTRNTKSQGTSSRMKTSKLQQREQDKEYVREFKLRTKCFNCGRKGH